MDIRPVGATALLLDLPSAVAVDAWRAELWRRRTAGELAAVEIVPGARTVLLDGVPDPAALARMIRTWTPPVASPSAEGLLVTIPTRYDGPDLHTIATLWRMSVSDVVAAHTGTEFRVGFCGFAPGFAYLTGLPADRAVPRLATPRTRVPAGSVALADTYCGVYPTESPGGWQLIGRTDAVLFDVHAEPPALLAPGVRVRFVEVQS